jgi:PUA domain protein
MFKRFTPEEISSTSQIKNSVQRTILSQITETYPNIEPHIEAILPKKSFQLAKGPDGIQLIIVNNEIVFFSVDRDGPFFPTLKIVHKYPSIMKKLQVDKGAISFVLGGANIMCPGFTSPGGSLATSCAAGEPVSIYSEGKDNCMAVGLTKMSTDDIKKVNKGIAVDNIHHLGDGLWATKSL